MPRTDPSREAALELVEQAKEALVAAVPSPRGVSRTPLAEALLAFEEFLREASSHADVHADSAAIDEALRRAERLRLDAPELDYEGLVDALADLLAPLDAFDDAARDPGQSTSRR